MAEISKQALKVVNNTNFPNNNSGEISPSDLRSFNVDMIDSTVSQTTYTSDSASWNASIDALEQFTSSQQPSFAALNAFTASQIGINSALTGFTSSANSRLTALEAETAALETFTASINQIQERGVVKGISTRLNFGGGAFVTASIVANVGGAIADITINSDTTKTGTGSFNAYTASTDARINSLEQFTASLDTTYVTQAELASATGALEDSIDTKLNTSSFDAFSQSIDSRVDALEAFSTSLDTNFASQTEFNSFTASIAGTNAFTQSANARLNSIEAQSGSWVTSAITASSLTTASFAAGTLTFTKGDGTTFGVTIPDVSGSILPAGTVSSSAQITDYGIFATLGGNTFTASQTITTGGNTDLTVQSTLSNGQTNLVLDAFQNNVTAKGNLSFTNNGQFGGSGSVKFISTLNNIEFASDSGTKIGPTNGGGNGINTQAISLQSHSGSLSLAPQGFSNTTASLSHISSSSGTNFVNLMFKNNSNTATTVISGSNNIFTNPTAPTAGFIRHIGGSHNLMLNSGSVPQISGSMLISPAFSNNILSNATTNAITLRGPVSASAYAITQNILMGGQINYGASAANSFDKATAGMTTNGNALFNGTINVNAPATPLSSSVNLSGNLLFGASVTLNCFSSSIAYNSNVQNGGITVNNNFLPVSGSNVAVLSARANVNTIYGIGHGLNISGTNTSTTQGKSFSYNIIAGTFLTSSIGTDDNCNILATGVIGNGLAVTGSTLTSTFAGPDTANSGQGSLFAGRFNALNGSRAKTGETVFAVGTGTSFTNRKTGFLIDSGSNTFVEGTLNVSGSTTLSGSLYIQSGSTFPDATGSTLLTWNASTGQVAQTPYSSALPVLMAVGAFYSTGSYTTTANVSGSFIFDTSLNVNSVVLANSGSKILVDRTGTYNLQYSIQMDNGASEADVAVWLKKNGTNVADTATVITIASNHKDVLALNLWDTATAGDYYELAYQSTTNNTSFATIAASGNIPRSPAIILTVNQVR